MFFQQSLPAGLEPAVSGPNIWDPCIQQQHHVFWNTHVVLKVYSIKMLLCLNTLSNKNPIRPKYFFLLQIYLHLCIYAALNKLLWALGLGMIGVKFKF